MREYKTIPDQAQWLQTFQWHNLRRTHGEELLQRMTNQGLFIFPNHQEEWSHNKDQLMKTNKYFPIAKLNADSQGPHSKTCASDKAGGLLPTLFLCKSAKVMLSVNISVPFGLFNGATGNIVDIVYLNGKTPKDGLPDVVMVHFQSYTGPPFMKENPKLVPIVPVQRRLECYCHFCKRKQIPLRLGWATTIHHCQGITVGEGESNRYIVINPGTRAFESQTPGALFVAPSRARSAGSADTDPDFAWHPSILVNEDRLCHAPCTPTVKARYHEILRIDRLSQNTMKKFAYLKNDENFLNYIHGICQLPFEE
jgi:hypothetical protein